MRYLKIIMARTKNIPEHKIHLVLATIPSMWTDQVESYTGFLKPEARSQVQRVYQDEIAKIAPLAR